MDGKHIRKLGMGVHTCDSSTGEEETGVSLRFAGRSAWPALDH